MNGTQVQHRSCGFQEPGAPGVVGERWLCFEAVPKGAVELQPSAYVGMSSDKRSENLLRRKPKVSWGR